MLRLFQQLLWRIYQLALGIAGIIVFFELGGEHLVGSGWPTVLSTFTVALFAAYYGTLITLRLTQKANAASLERRERHALRHLPLDASSGVKNLTHKTW